MKFEGTKEQWNQFFLKEPTQVGLFLQSWEWGEFVASTGERVFRFDIDGVFVQVFEKKLFLGLRFWYAPRCVLNEQRIDVLKNIARRDGVVFVRVEPFKNVNVGIKVRAVQPQQTSVVSFFDNDELLACMHQKTRYNIRLADRKGVSVEFSKQYIDDFLRLMKVTGVRNNFGIFSESYYRAQINRNDVFLVVGKFEGKVICAHVYWQYGDACTYVHGASDNEHRNVMAPYAVHWAAMQYARENGAACFDFWGIDEKKWPALTLFKRRFGGEDVLYVGCFDVVVRRWWYGVYRFVRFVRRLVS